MEGNFFVPGTHQVVHNVTNEGKRNLWYKSVVCTNLHDMLIDLMDVEVTEACGLYMYAG